MTPSPTNQTNPPIILITGNMASGKSTVAQALAERLPKSVHLRGDVFRRMIINGQAEMTFDLSEAAKEQLQLRYDLGVTVAKRFVDAGFTVVYQDIIIGSTLNAQISLNPFRIIGTVLLIIGVILIQKY
ncbi:MAG: adenylyl-sulfate kinase [Methylacidiphilales bacterium]|nr:adenylyl-sulfate kinase [Candidatus Methylacidiphilales bacterium]NJR18708.1 adenylyl-sulfate kinase [Calothrix sp. CSU_2_0]